MTMRLQLRRATVLLLILCCGVESFWFTLNVVVNSVYDASQCFPSVFGFTNPGLAGGFVALGLVTAVGVFVAVAFPKSTLR